MCKLFKNLGKYLFSPSSLALPMFMRPIAYFLKFVHLYRGDLRCPCHGKATSRRCGPGLLGRRDRAFPDGHVEVFQRSPEAALQRSPFKARGGW